MPEDQLAVSAYDDGISVIASQTQRRLSNVDVAAAVPTSAEEVDEAIPDGGYGWVCLVAVMLINANTWGVNSVRGRASRVKGYPDNIGRSKY